MSLTSLAIFASLAITPLAFQVRPASFLGTNTSKPGHYGKNKCPCVGIDNLKGWFSLPFGKYHVLYPNEIGASCEAWEKNRYPECKKADPPEWCSQKWCYVDPCQCDLEILPKMTVVGIQYQGSDAYWSYDTCGGKDEFSKEVEDACVNQMTEEKCSKLPKCAWDGDQCGGKEAINTCEKADELDENIVGKEDCRCVGHTGKNGIAKMHINDTHEVDYPADVGGRCEAWESFAHPDCKKEGEKPSWCSMKWCWVDPCKCKTKVPPKATMKANSDFKFQGTVAHWSYETCGSVDEWSSTHKGQYCNSNKNALDCSAMDKCAWTGEKCVTKEVAEGCHGHSGTVFPHSGAHKSALASIALLGAFAAMQ